MNNLGIELVAVDMDGSFMRNNYTYDVDRFERLLTNITAADAKFCVATGNQYHQVAHIFASHADKFAFVANNGAYVIDGNDVMYASDIPAEAVRRVSELLFELDGCRAVMCGVRSAYMLRAGADQEFFDYMLTFYPQMQWTSSFTAINDQILSFSINVPVERTAEYLEVLTTELDGVLAPVTTEVGFIDLTLPGVSKAQGIRRLCEALDIPLERCVAFGNGGNDIEMLKLVGTGWAMDNAPGFVKEIADGTCHNNDEDGLLRTLEWLFPSGDFKGEDEV